MSDGRLVCLLALMACLLGTSSAFFPDLSSYPSNVTALRLGGLGITEVPAGAFTRFTALIELCVHAVESSSCS
jgi:hypothetical protein